MIDYDALEEQYGDMPEKESPKIRPQGSLTNLGVYLMNRARGGAKRRTRIYRESRWLKEADSPLDKSPSK